MGDEVPSEIVKLMLFLKVRALSFGHSGIALKTVDQLVSLFNKRIYPIVFEQGSLGASGDLAPLAHMSLPLLGKGEVRYEGKRLDAVALTEKFNWSPIKLGAKEGLALINGTQFMSAYGTWCLLETKKLLAFADLIGAISFDAYGCLEDPLYPKIHSIRNQTGQIESAKNIAAYLGGSELLAQDKEQVQDPYSFRCMPQVHGASRFAWQHVLEVFLNEINGVSDNPNIFPDEDVIVSGGNFHGQPVALALDYLAIATAELGSISERRTFNLLDGERGLPPFLVSNPGLNSGLMIPQYTAASIVSQNKQLCTPSSVDSISSSNGQEDHVSMGANAATKCYRVVNNVKRVLAIELLTAAQAMGFRQKKSSDKLEAVLDAFRKEVSFNEHDRLLSTDLNKSIDFLQSSKRQRQNSTGAKKLNFMFELVGIIQKWWKRILLVALVTTIGSIVFSLFLKDEFKSVAKVLPMNPNYFDKTAIYGEETSKPTYLFGSDSDVDRLISLSESERLNEYLIGKYDLYQRYLIDPEKKDAAFNLRKRLRKNFKVTKDPAGHLELSFYDRDPEFAAAVANDVASKVDEYNKAVLLEKKIQVRDLLKQEASIKQAEVSALVDSLQRETLRANGDTIKTSVLAGLIEGKVEELNAVQKNYKQNASLVDLDFSSLYYLEKAQPANRKDRPVRSLIVIGTFAMSFFFMTLWAIFIEKYRDYNKTYA